MGLAYSLWRHTPDFIALGIVLVLQWQLCRWTRAWGVFARSGPARRVLAAAHLASALWVGCSALVAFSTLVRLLPPHAFWSWFRGLGLAWGIAVGGLFVATLLARRIPHGSAPASGPEGDFSPGRRHFLRAAQGALLASPVAVTAFGVVVNRRQFELREIELAAPGLPADLDGLRLVQLTDIHLGPFLEPREFARAVDMANAAKPDLALVTGDLISHHGDPLEECLDELARLRASAGVFGCMGNHEAYAGALAATERGGARRGIRFLRSAAVRLRFGQATLNLAGVDYQPFRRPYLKGAERMAAPGAYNVLLSHNPDVFPVAARQGYDFVVAGHTHGGQVTVEVLHQYVNVARFFTPFVQGLYRLDRAALYVSRGIGTVGLPARLGAAPEVSLIRLCAT